MKHRIAIALGDPAGIGPEVALKAALDPRVRAACAPILVGDPAALAVHAAACGLRPRVRAVERVEDARPDDDIVVLARRQLEPGELKLGAVAAAHGRSAVDSARAAVREALKGAAHAVVAAPHTEQAIALAGIPFDGYPGLVARETGCDPEDVVLMLCWDQMRIAHATLHVAVREALERLTATRVAHTIRATDAALKKLGIPAPRLAVSGLNPHAGEGGLFGREDFEVIAPAIATAQADGVRAEGPFGADTMFGRPGYDGFVVMLHDQGHIPAKLLAPNRTAALTIGTPVLFSSVGHGSALDIAGKNQANPAAMIEAVLRLAGVPHPHPPAAGAAGPSLSHERGRGA
ncbi:MAG TPA: 4-hydroxythreonine-4-phosphate dehydrogenase PdxA [Alphaproteobacteria bacterium]|nr:4-hydroxythreonine-4-phosphate dehydrogenase PdxA [Alphaproteobacteria bacterium]